MTFKIENLKPPFSRFIVQDRSMLPYYKPGDHVLTFNWIFYKTKDVIVFAQRGQYFIKRIDKIGEKKIYVYGDNKRESAKIKPVSKDQIIGRVVLKY